MGCALWEGMNNATYAVEYACSTDRPGMTAPFGVTLAGRRWLAATDGDRAALVRCANAPTRADAPSLGKVLTLHVPVVGEIQNSRELRVALKAFPRRWNVYLTFAHSVNDPTLVTVTVSVPRKKGPIPLVTGGRFPIALRLATPDARAIDAHYLADALEALPYALVRVRQGGQLDPYLLTGPAGFNGAHAAVIMPVRVSP